MATYTKLKDGSWGVRASGKVTAGASLTVTKKDGSTKVETVKVVLWTGPDSKTRETISLCAIAQSNGGSNAHSSSHRPGTCCKCDGQLNDWERRHGVRCCADCRDGGGNAHGGMSYYDRHGNFVLGDDD